MVVATGRHPMEEAGIFSKLLYIWILPLIYKGNKKDLTKEDLYGCPDKDRSKSLGIRLERCWKKELERKAAGKPPSLLRAILRAFGFDWFLASLNTLIKECVIQPALALCIGAVVQAWSEEQDTESYLTYSPIVFCVLVLCQQIFNHLAIFQTMRIGMDLRVACSALAYGKVLNLSQASLSRTTTGQIVNIFSNDVSRFDMGMGMVPYIVIAPLQSLLIAGIIYYRYGLPFLAGLLLIPLFLLLQSVMARLFSKLRMKTAALTDDRIRLMSEVISGMRVLKMYAWESTFASMVHNARKKEVGKIRLSAFLRGVNASLFFVASKMIVLASLVTAALVSDGQKMTAEAVFVVMAMANVLRLTTTLFLPLGVSFGAESMATIKRLQEFLLLDERDESKVPTSMGSRPSNDRCLVELEKLSCHWSKDAKSPALSNINLTVKPGQLLMVVGPVGSGKTSLLMSILGELPPTSGNVRVLGKVAYSAQQAWLQTGSVKENILFGRPFNAARYREVIHAACLERDLSVLPHGDQTLVGERGVSLSGGQKARVNLARALYQDADVYLLDDPLSAVDAAVATHIFEKCINGFLKEKIRILCTHQIQFLNQADQILIIKEGRPLAVGTHDQLVNSGVDVGSLLESASPTPSKNEIKESTPIIKDIAKKESQEEFGGELAPPQVQDEALSTGTISPRVYFQYTSAGAGVFLQIILLLTYVGSQILFNGSDYFLKMWTDAETTCQPIVGPTGETVVTCQNNSPHDEMTYIWVYVGLVGGLFILSMARNLGFFSLCLRASVRLHSDMVARLFRAPVRFFDTNPVGNILNRCSRDMGIIDDLLPQTASECIEILFTIVGILAVISVLRYFLVVPALALVVAFVVLRRIFLAAGRDIKRLEGRARAPVFSHLSTSVDGLATLRAYGAQHTFQSQYYHLQDDHSAAWFLCLTSTEWFGVALDLFCLVYISAVTAVVVLTSNMDGGEIGLAIASALGVSGEFMWGARQSTEVENHMTSVERVLQYNTSLESEAEVEGPPPSIPGWPQHGAIHFDHVLLRYTPDGPVVLDDITFMINPGEKVGVVGRTGAGKSSLLAALFRLVELSEGDIWIDGIRTSELPLKELRSAIAIIPQDPVIFTGTIRYNLDPLGEHDDDALWCALEEVHLKSGLVHSGTGLDSEVTVESFSVGQRQLLCLARAILRNSRILVLDEATANVDPETDAVIQRTLRERFADRTVVAIAHRLHTVMGCDRVLVMEAGRVREFDSPFYLLQQAGGLFRSMVAATGPSSAAALLEMAREHHVQRLAATIEDIEVTRL